MIGATLTLRDCIIEYLHTAVEAKGNNIFSAAVAKGFNVTIQAVYKELRSLIAQGVVVKIGGLYRLKLSWILDIAEWAENTRRNYFASNAIVSLLPQGNKSVILNFSDLFSLNDCWSQVLLALVSQDKQRPLLGYSAFAWYYHVQYEQEIKFQASIEKLRGKLYYVVGNRTVFDKLCESYFDKKYMEWYFGTPQTIVSLKAPQYVNVCGSYIVKVVLDRQVEFRLKQLYRSNTPLSDFIKKLIDIARTHGKHKLYIYHNPLTAKKYYNTLSKFFGFKNA